MYFQWKWRIFDEETGIKNAYVIVIFIKSRVGKRSRLVNRKSGGISDMAHANFGAEDRYSQFWRRFLMSETRIEIVTADPTLENLHELCQKYPPLWWADRFIWAWIHHLSWSIFIMFYLILCFFFLLFLICFYLCFFIIMF